MAKLKLSKSALLPVLKRVECRVADYSLLAKPAWVDALVERLNDAAEQRKRSRSRR